MEDVVTAIAISLREEQEILQEGTIRVEVQVIPRDIEVLHQVQGEVALQAAIHINQVHLLREAVIDLRAGRVADHHTEVVRVVVEAQEVLAHQDQVVAGDRVLDRVVRAVEAVRVVEVATVVQGHLEENNYCELNNIDKREWYFDKKPFPYL